jgi:two-component system chemotaxis response regulator CheB
LLKRLSSKYSNSSEFFILNKEESFIVFKGEESYSFIFLINLSDEDILRLKAFPVMEDLRFIGSEHDFKTILSFISEDCFSSKKFISNQVELRINKETGKVSFRNNTSVEIRGTSLKRKVLVVDDSKAIRKVLSRLISDSEELEVMDVACDAQEARDIIEKNRPDLVTLDIHMPGINGVEFLKTFLKPQGISTVMISSVSMSEGELVMDALASGALSYIEKPSLESIKTDKNKIIKKLELLSQKKQIFNFENRDSTEVESFSSKEGIIAIGSSTGGTQALEKILKQLPKEVPPILIVQHIPAVFSKAFADRLDSVCSFKVKEAIDGETVESNTVYIAPGGKQMKILKRGELFRLEINDDPPVNRFQPSVDYFFNSLKGVAGSCPIVGVILTGMGKDGAMGLLELHKIGAATIAQDEESSVVYGMPKEAVRIGAVDEIVALNKIPSELVRLFQKVVRKKNSINLEEKCQKRQIS